MITASAIPVIFVRVREMVVGKDIDKVYMVMDFGGMDLKVMKIYEYCDAVLVLHENVMHCE